MERLSYRAKGSQRNDHLWTRSRSHIPRLTGEQALHECGKYKIAWAGGLVIPQEFDWVSSLARSSFTAHANGFLSHHHL